VEREDRERTDCWWRIRPEINEKTILSMDPAKLLAIAEDLRVVTPVLDVLDDAREKGRDVSAALAVLPSRDNIMPWCE
jgi:hypothetical protein